MKRMINFILEARRGSESHLNGRIFTNKISEQRSLELLQIFEMCFKWGKMQLKKISIYANFR